MQQLHLVGLTTDLDSLIYSARKGAKSGGFVLRLDEHLLQVIAEAVSRRNADGVEIEVPGSLQPSVTAPRRQSHLSPREIQDRLRAGRSLEEIAAEAGVGEEWVARFAAPVEAERSQVVGRARRLTFDRPRHGDSGEPLGMSVRWNLADRGVRLANDEFDAAWSAYQLADAAWMVTFSFESRKREHEAEWEVDLATNELLSRNRLATELGYVEPGRRRRATASLQPLASAAAVARARSDAAADAGDGEGAVPARPSAGRTSGAAKKRAGGAAKKASGRTRKSTAATKKRALSSRASGTTKKATKKPAQKAGKKAAKKPAQEAGKKAAKKAGKKAAPRARPVTRSTSSTAKKSSTTKRAAPARRTATTARRAPAKKAPARTTTRRTGRKVPPATITAAAPTALADDRPVPNELGRRRLQLVSGTPAPRTTGRPGTGASGGPPAAMPAVRIAAARSGDVAAAQRRATQRPEPASPPVRSARSARSAGSARSAEIVAPEPGLDVSDSEAAAEARRVERRRARAAARDTPPPPPPSPMAATRTGGGGEEDDDGRVVMIRANRASPPRGDAEIVLPLDRPALRPAQPATQPRKRRFNRNGR